MQTDRRRKEGSVYAKLWRQSTANTSYSHIFAIHSCTFSAAIIARRHYPRLRVRKLVASLLPIYNFRPCQNTGLRLLSAKQQRTHTHNPPEPRMIHKSIILLCCYRAFQPHSIHIVRQLKRLQLRHGYFALALALKVNDKSNNYAIMRDKIHFR